MEFIGRQVFSTVACAPKVQVLALVKPALPAFVHEDHEDCDSQKNNQHDARHYTSTNTTRCLGYIIICEYRNKCFSVILKIYNQFYYCYALQKT